MLQLYLVVLQFKDMNILYSEYGILNTLKIISFHIIISNIYNIQISTPLHDATNSKCVATGARLFNSKVRSINDKSDWKLTKSHFSSGQNYLKNHRTWNSITKPTGSSAVTTKMHFVKRFLRSARTRKQRNEVRSAKSKPSRNRGKIKVRLPRRLLRLLQRTSHRVWETEKPPRTLQLQSGWRIGLKRLHLARHLFRGAGSTHKLVWWSWRASTKRTAETYWRRASRRIWELWTRDKSQLV